MVQPAPFVDFDFPGQRTLSSAPWIGTDSESRLFPLALRTTSQIKTLEEFVASIERLADEDAIVPLLNLHGGAILFRGTHATTPDDFSRIAHAFKIGMAHEEVCLACFVLLVQDKLTQSNLPKLANPVIRTVLAKNVATANEGPPTHPVFPHSEFGWSSHYPAFLFFFCRHPAESGGETPINSGAEIFARLQKEVPEFVKDLAEKVRCPVAQHPQVSSTIFANLDMGITYVYRYPVEKVPGSNLGNSILAAYPAANVLPTDDEATKRAKVETQIQRHSDTWKWNDDGTLSVTHRLSSIRRHPYSKLPVYFGNITSMYLKAQSQNALEPPYKGDDGAFHHIPTYGDGTPIPNRYLQKTADLIAEIRVLVPWEQGDVLLLDNHLPAKLTNDEKTDALAAITQVQHAREPWVGDRRVLASLWDGPASLPY
ncbi:SPOSA6832_04438, partial [Sporobolomyces salmonicolor]